MGARLGVGQPGKGARWGSSEGWVRQEQEPDGGGAVEWGQTKAEAKYGAGVRLDGSRSQMRARGGAKWE